ncbi:hypothetical protein WP50_05580 [Lactiplantibacillus plantarum]|nr:hypothetical protein WP50_05580 [Lactiplantibacillus plantarum]
MAKPMKQCEHPGCRTLVAYDTRYCEKHRKATNKWRYHKRMYDSDESKYQQFYKSSAWRKLSRRFLESNPIDSDNVIDIKFSSNAFGADLDSSSAEYCAMIIYK